MKQLFILPVFLFIAFVGKAQDTTFWEFAKDFEIGEKGTKHYEWGRDAVTYLGTVMWKSPGGKELPIRIVTTYRQITQANGFNDASILALVKDDHTLIKAYDMVKRQNLPIRIEDNELIYKPEDKELVSPLPPKFAMRFCVRDLTCFTETDPNP